MEHQIPLPKQIKAEKENNFEAVYEIEGLYPGYGYTIGHSLRRIILSSLPGAAITKIKIAGVNHEFSTIDGVKEDVINIILNLKQVRFKMFADEPITFTTEIKGVKNFTAEDLKTPSQLETLNKNLYIAALTSKNAVIKIETTVEKGLGYSPKETIEKEKMETGTIALDAIFSPIRKINYEVENMRVGEKTDYNRLRIIIETDGTTTPKEVIDKSIKIMINQFNALSGEAAPEKKEKEQRDAPEEKNKKSEKEQKKEEDALKIRVEDLSFSTRTLNALSQNGVRTIGGLVKKRELDLIELEGVGDKAIKEIRKELSKLGLCLKE